jgi:hypothetical protein
LWRPWWRLHWRVGERVGQAGSGCKKMPTCALRVSSVTIFISPLGASIEAAHAAIRTCNNRANTKLRRPNARLLLARQLRTHDACETSNNVSGIQRRWQKIHSASPHQASSITTTGPVWDRGFCPSSRRPRARVPLVVWAWDFFCSAASLPWSPGPCSPTCFSLCDCFVIKRMLLSYPFLAPRRCGTRKCRFWHGGRTRTVRRGGPVTRQVA